MNYIKLNVSHLEIVTLIFENGDIANYKNNKVKV